MTGMVIIGAGMAGHRAVISLRAGGYDGAITLIGEEALMPYDRPPLSKAAIAEEPEPAPVWLMDEGIADSLKAVVHRNAPAQRIDRRNKSVVLENGSTVPYEKLLIATGAKPRVLSLPGGDKALLLRNFEDALALRQQFQPGKRIAIIGGGFIGLELASSAAKRGSKVTLIEAQPRILMRGVPEAIARIVHARHELASVEMLTGVAIKALDENGVLLADGRRIEADAIVAGIGAAPEVRLASEAGLNLENGIAVSSTLQTSDPDIFAAGDCCSFPHPLFGGRRIRLEAWRNAQDQGSLAAENMLGAGKVYQAVPWFWSDQYDLSLQVAGLADSGPRTVERKPAQDSLMLFHLDDGGVLKGASAIGPGNSIARDIKLAEMMIAKGMKPDPAALADNAVQLRSLLKG